MQQYLHVTMKTLKTEHDMKVNKNKAKKYKNNYNNSTQVHI